LRRTITKRRTDDPALKHPRRLNFPALAS
jgi:hypothetical protein